MKKLRGPAMPLLALAVAIVWVGFVQAGPLEDLVAAAKKEGAIEFYGPSTLGPDGAQALIQAFNNKYGLNTKLGYNPSGNMTRDIAKVIGLSASGVAPEWAGMVVTDAHHGSLWLCQLRQRFRHP